MLSKSQITISAAIALTASLAIAAPGHDRFPIDISEVENKTAERFATMDTDGNGTVELNEFEAAEHPRRGHHGKHRAGNSHPNREAMGAEVEQEMFVILDADSDGNVTKAEYAKADHRTARKLAHKRAMFKRLDKDASGTLTISELPNPAERIKQADTNGDGQVTRDEMRAARHGRATS